MPGCSDSVMFERLLPSTLSSAEAQYRRPAGAAGTLGDEHRPVAAARPDEPELLPLHRGARGCAGCAGCAGRALRRARAEGVLTGRDRRVRELTVGTGRDTRQQRHRHRSRHRVRAGRRHHELHGLRRDAVRHDDRAFDLRGADQLQLEVHAGALLATGERDRRGAARERRAGVVDRREPDRRVFARRPRRSGAGRSSRARRADGTRAAGSRAARARGLLRGGDRRANLPVRHRANLAGRRRSRCRRDDVVAGRQAVEPVHAAVVGRLDADQRAERGHERALALRHPVLHDADAHAERRLPGFVEDPPGDHAAARERDVDVRELLAFADRHQRARPIGALGAVGHANVARLRRRHVVAIRRQASEAVPAGVVGGRRPDDGAVVAVDRDPRAANRLLRRAVAGDRPGERRRARQRDGRDVASDLAHLLRRRRCRERDGESDGERAHYRTTRSA